MNRSRLLDRNDSVLVVIDVQEGFRDKLFEHGRMVGQVRRLVEVAKAVGVPIVATEQYPKGLGRTQAEVALGFPPGVDVFEKLSMSCCGQAEFVARLQDLGKGQVVVCGIEAHACVNQTVHDLLERGYQPHVPRDAITSRFEADGLAAWEKMIGSGAVPATVEMVALEWVRTAAAPEFKAVQKLIK